MCRVFFGLALLRKGGKKLIRNPLNPYPSNQKIFIPNDKKINFGFVFSGDVLNSYYIYAQWHFRPQSNIDHVAEAFFTPSGKYYIDATHTAADPPSWSPLDFPYTDFSSLTYPNDLILSTPAFNGEEVSKEFSISNEDWEVFPLPSDGSFVWCIVMSPNIPINTPTVDAETGDAQIYSNPFITQVYSFDMIYNLFVYSTPTQASSDINKIKINGTTDKAIVDMAVSISNYESSIIELDGYIFQDLECYQVFLCFLFFP